MSNARDTGTSPFTTEQNQRAEAVACAVAALGQIRQHDDRVAAYEVVQVAEFITGHPHHTIDAEFVGDAPEPEAGDASATVKATEVTECQWPGCWEEVDVGIPPTLTVRYATYDYLRPACGTHAGLSVSVG